MNEPTPLQKAVERLKYANECNHTLREDIHEVVHALEALQTENEGLKELVHEIKVTGQFGEGDIVEQMLARLDARAADIHHLNAIYSDRDFLKSALQLMEHGKYGRVDLTNQILELKSALIAAQRERNDYKKLSDDYFDQLADINNKLIATQAALKETAEALREALKEHNDSLRECSEIGYSDGLFLKSALEKRIKQALSNPLVNKAMEGK